jgi:hypothetical protein
VIIRGVRNGRHFFSVLSGSRLSGGAFIFDQEFLKLVLNNQFSLLNEIDKLFDFAHFLIFDQNGL